MLVKGTNGSLSTGLSSLKTQYYLKGQVISQTYQVDTTKGSGTATIAAVTSGDLTFGPLTITSSPAYIPVTGTLNTYSLDGGGKYKVTKGSAVLPVGGALTTTLKAGYAYDAGIAKSWGKKGFFASKDTVLNGRITAKGVVPGTPYIQVNLASKLAPKGTLANEAGDAIPVDAKGKSNLKNLYKAVGSEAEIVASDVAADGGIISMEWRQRTAAEAYAPKSARPDPSMPRDRNG